MQMDLTPDSQQLISRTSTNVLAEEASERARQARRQRRWSVLSLLFLILVFLTSGLGIALSVIIEVLQLQSDSSLDVPSRSVLFAASCISQIYVAMHLLSSRRAYVKDHRPPQTYGEYAIAVTIALARLAFAVWTAAVVTSALVAKDRAPDLSLGAKGNIGWAQLIVSGPALLSAIAMLTLVESARRPFATVGISPASFTRGGTPVSPGDEPVMQPKSAKMKREEVYDGEPQPEKMKKRRKTLTKKRPPTMGMNDQSETFGSKPERSFSVIRYSEDRRRVRSQPIPTPLESIFATRVSPAADSPSVKGDFAWKPPVQDLSFLRQSGITSFSQISEESDRMSLVAQTSVASSSASGSIMEPTIPSFALDTQRQPRNQAVPRTPSAYAKRWTMAYPPSNSYNPNGVLPTRPTYQAPIPRPKSSNAVMRRPLPQGAPQHPPLPYPMPPRTSQGFSTNNERSRFSYASTVSYRPARQSTADSANREQSRFSYASTVSYRPPRQSTADLRRSTVASMASNASEIIPDLPMNPTIPDLTRTPSAMTNFSRPRTAAAAMMRIKTKRRLDAARELGILRPEPQQDAFEPADEPVQSVAPRPRTAAAALMQRAVEKRIQNARLREA